MEETRITYIKTIGNWITSVLEKTYYTIVENSSFRSCLQNGYYIPPVHLALYYITGDAVISTVVAMKMYPANYFYWFGHHYDFRIPKSYNWIKQFVRFTDTGYLALFIYIVYPDFFPIAYNIHYTITVGYWIGKALGALKHVDLLDEPALNRSFEMVWTDVNHGIHFAILTYRMVNDDMCYDHFTIQALKWSYGWMYTWLFGIYMPWRLITGDCVYRIFSSEISLSKKMGFMLMMHVIVAFGHTTGYLLSMRK